MKKILCITFTFFVSHLLFAQYYFENDKFYSGQLTVELGAGIGIINCMTDVGGKEGLGKPFIKDINLHFAKPVAGLYALTTYRSIIGIRLEISTGKIIAYDSILKKVRASTYGRYERNLEFRSRIHEMQLALEFHPVFLFAYEDDPPYVSPYLIAGAGIFCFNPEAFIDERWQALQPLSTEGQGFREYPDRKKYKLRQWNLPFGIGLKYEVGTFTNVRLEVIYRKLFTDYLDDVSTSYIDPNLFQQYHTPGTAVIATRLANRSKEYNYSTARPGDSRGNSANNDSYFTVEIKLGLVLKKRI